MLKWLRCPQILFTIALLISLPFIGKYYLFKEKQKETDSMFQQYRNAIVRSIVPPQFAISSPKDYIPVHPKSECNIQAFPYHLLNWHLKLKNEQTFVLNLKRGKAYGLDGVVVTEKNELVSQVNIEFETVWEHPKDDCKPIDQHYAFKALKTHKKYDRIYIPGKVATVASNAAGHCYYHWIFQLLPRLEILRQSGVKYDKLLINPLSFPSQKQMLHVLGIPEDKLIFTKLDQYLEADELIVPSYSSQPYSIAPWVIGFLRDKFLPKTTYKPEKKIYINRKSVV